MIEELAPRRRQLLVLKANGLTNQQAADRMGITKNTAESMLSIILRQLGADNITHAVAIGLAIGEIGNHEVDITRPESKAA